MIEDKEKKKLKNKKKITSERKVSEISMNFLIFLAGISEIERIKEKV